VPGPTLLQKTGPPVRRQDVQRQGNRRDRDVQGATGTITTKAITSNKTAATIVYS
jgi:hypothetical protein